MKRWRKDGPDYLIGSQTFNKYDLPRNDGGMCAWRHDNTWSAFFWFKRCDLSNYLIFDKLEYAKAYVEAVLKRGC
jgi:hypothetical protein